MDPGGTRRTRSALTRSQVTALAVAVTLALSWSSSGTETDGTCEGGHGLSNGSSAEFFPGIPRIEYLGPDSTNPLSFRYYNADELIVGKRMRDWLRFSVAFWHTLRGDGSDPFGSPTKNWPWEDPSLPPMEMAKRRMGAHFELLEKLGVDYWCFHDRDIAPEGATWAETNSNLDEIVALAEQFQSQTGKRVLWGTAQLFKHPRYMHGAATSPNAEVVAFAAAQAKKAIEITHRLRGENFVFWGGREGYHTLRNTDMKQELEHLAAFLRMAVSHKTSIGFNGTFLLEPKPQEPTKHQYDWDVSTTVGFLRQFGLASDFKINVECNHATLAGHSCEHELETASLQGMLGNIDANTGDPQTGWDTDQFITDPKECLLLMAVVLRQGGLSPGGINFDAKLRRESTAVEDLFYAHIGSMDALARGLRNAARMLEDGKLAEVVERRYASFRETSVGQRIHSGVATFAEMEEFVLSSSNATGFLSAEDVPSGHAEYMELLLANYIT
mmetsp:Transcript_9678/g.27667  ORF Transcript_9678/g.27667 Transcript_9678/m.27667 type:complete len:499 (-) Transcript_9678:302-1798(-)